MSDIEFGILLSKFKKVSPNDYSVLSPYWVARGGWASIPRYFQSVGYMVCTGYFYWATFEDDILVVLKHTVGYNACNHVYFVISRSGSLENELRYVNLFLDRGFALKIVKDELVRWGLEGDRRHDYDEYAYDMSATSKCEGGVWARFRSAFKKLINLPDYRHVVGITGCEEGVFALWDAYHKEHVTTKDEEGKQSHLWKRIKSSVDDKNIICHSVWANGTPIAVAILERITDTQWVSVFNIRNYSEDAVALCHDYRRGFAKVSADMIYSQGGVYLNRGSCGSADGLIENKMSLHPCAVLEVYQVPSRGKVDTDFVNRIFRGDIDFLFSYGIY